MRTPSLRQLTRVAAFATLLAGGSGGAPYRTVFAASHAPVAGESCYAGKDLVVQALEQLKPDSPASQLSNANEHLKRAIDLCSESGEAWYYRSLVEEKLNDAARAAFSKRQAVKFGSDALLQHINPFVLAAPREKQDKALPPVRQRWALVIGIGAFADGSVKPLAYTTDDAKVFYNFLVDTRGGAFPEGNARLLTNGQATLRGIKESLNWLARSAGPDDLVVVYIASHGSARDVDTAGANYILAHDTELGADINPDKLYATALPMVDLANDIATRFQARRTAVFLDTCYSGGAFKPGDHQLAPGISSAAISQATLDHITQGAGRIIFAASRTDQQSLESQALHHGYFTYFLVEALRANPGQPLSQVFAALQQKVGARVDTDYALYGLHQTPVMNRSSEATDFSLGAATGPTAALVAENRR